jgi:hypothetical protein
MNIHMATKLANFWQIPTYRKEPCRPSDTEEDPGISDWLLHILPAFGGTVVRLTRDLRQVSATFLRQPMHI